MSRWSQSRSLGTAQSLESATTVISVSTAAAPVAGQVLTAIDSEHADWGAGGGYTDEDAEDAVGGILATTATVALTYNDGAPSISGAVVANSVDVTLMHATQTDVLFGRSSALAGAGEEVPCTATGRAALNTASAAALATVVGVGTGNSPTFTGLTTTGSVAVGGNLVVSGATVTNGVVELEDNYVTLNDGYTTDAAITSGFVKVIDPTITTTVITVGGFIAGIDGVSNPTIAVTSHVGFAANDIVSVSGAGANDGLFEVLTAAGNLITVRGVGLSSNTEAWARNQLATAVGAGSVTKVNVAVDRTGTDGILERAYGSTVPMTYSDYYYVSGTDVAVADGGTGMSAYTTGDVLYASAAGTLAGLADVAVGSALLSGGVGVAPVYGQVALASAVTGTLPVANGGTGVTTVAAEEAALVAVRPNVNLIGRVYPLFGGTSGLGNFGYGSIPSLSGAAGSYRPISAPHDFIFETTSTTLAGTAGYAAPASAHYTLGVCRSVDMTFGTHATLTINANARLGIGMVVSGSVVTNNDPPANCIYGRLDGSENSNWWWVNKGVAADNQTDTTYTMLASSFYRARFEFSSSQTVRVSLWIWTNGAAGVSGSWSVCAGTTATITTNLPSDTQTMSHTQQIVNIVGGGGTAVTFYVGENTFYSTGMG